LPDESLGYISLPVELYAERDGGVTVVAVGAFPVVDSTSADWLAAQSFQPQNPATTVPPRITPKTLPRRTAAPVLEALLVLV
jgi:hypothetical protein